MDEGHIAVGKERTRARASRVHVRSTQAASLSTAMFTGVCPGESAGPPTCVNVCCSLGCHGSAGVREQPDLLLRLLQGTMRPSSGRTQLRPAERNRG